jgi:plasmid segregation protein ParM
VSDTKIYRAADVGYGWTKFSTGPVRADGDGRIVIDAQGFQSAPFQRVAGFEMGSVGKLPKMTTVSVAGISYCVSEDPTLLGPAASTRIEGDNFVSSVAHEVCLAAAIKEMGVNEIESLVLGTPVGNFATAKEALLKKFSDGITFDGRSVPIRQLRVLAQPIGGLVWHYFSTSRASELKGVQRLLVDVGYGTLDWVVTQGLIPNPTKSGSTRDGVSKFIDAVCRMLEDGQSGIDKDAVTIEGVDKLITRNTPFVYGGREWTFADVAPQVAKIAEDATQKILASIGRTKTLQSVVLMGGGARLYQSVLHKALQPLKIELIGDAQYANVNGFQLIAEPKNK